MTKRKFSQLKPLFEQRMSELLSNKEDFNKYLNSIKEYPMKSIRCNTLKISPEKLKKRLEEKDWKIKLPFKKYPEIMIIENHLVPWELGKSIEHFLGHYYVQDLSSMIPAIALAPKQEEIVLDLCSAPGSKTTQIAALMKNTGLIIANEMDFKRKKILSINLERCGVLNTIITKKEGSNFSKKIIDKLPEFKFDKILIDAPCSKEGTIMNDPKVIDTWNIKKIKKLSKLQKKLILISIPLLKKSGEIIYSTCTHAPEENEEVINFILEKYPNLKIGTINLPEEIKFRPGLTSWKNKKFSDELINTIRIYQQDNNSEGFFIAKLKR